MRVGAAEVDTTPALGVPLAGYGPGLDRTVERVERPLSVQAVVVEDGGTLAAVVSCDLLAVTPSFVDAVVAGLARRRGERPSIAREHLMVCATHAHTTPTVAATREWGAVDRRYVKRVVNVVVRAITTAQDRLEPARWFAGSTQHGGLAWNRTEAPAAQAATPDGFVGPDETVRTLNAVADDGRVIAIIGHFACHPVVLGPVRAASPDFPGPFREALKRHHPASVVLYLNGACGDIDPVSNRERWGAGTSADVDRFGAGLAESALRALGAARPVRSEEVAGLVNDLEVPYALPTLDDVSAGVSRYARERRSRRDAPDEGFGAPAGGEGSMPAFWHRYHRTLRARLLRGQSGSERVTLHGIRFGDDVALLGIPAEVYTAQGRALTSSSPFPHTLCVCYAGGCCGYLPPAAEFERSGYTTRLAAAVYDRPPFAADVAQRLVAGGVELLHELWARKVPA